MRPDPKKLKVKKYKFKKMIDGYPVPDTLKAAFVALQHSLLKYNMFSLKYRIVVEPMPVPDSPVKKFKRKIDGGPVPVPVTAQFAFLKNSKDS